MQDKWTDGDAYEMYVGRWSRRVGEKFLSWLDAPSDLRWLDLSCGTGALTSQILQDCLPSSVIGIEPSEGFLSLAREFLQGSGDKLPVEDGSADLVVSGLVLNFIPEQQKAMAEFIRAVKPGGTIAAYV